jgi:hypothetical protein
MLANSLVPTRRVVRVRTTQTVDMEETLRQAEARVMRWQLEDAAKVLQKVSGLACHLLLSACHPCLPLFPSMRWRGGRRASCAPAPSRLPRLPDARATWLA